LRTGVFSSLDAILGFVEAGGLVVDLPETDQEAVRSGLHQGVGKTEVAFVSVVRAETRFTAAEDDKIGIESPSIQDLMAAQQAVVGRRSPGDRGRSKQAQR
jgi:hypothetical protein